MKMQQTLVRVFHRVAELYPISFPFQMECGRTGQLTQGDPQSHNSRHQSPCGRSADRGRASYERRASIQHTAGSAHIVDAHKATAREGDAPVIRQVQHIVSCESRCQPTCWRVKVNDGDSRRSTGQRLAGNAKVGNFV